MSAKQSLSTENPWKFIQNDHFMEMHPLFNPVDCAGNRLICTALLLKKKGGGDRMIFKECGYNLQVEKCTRSSARV